MRIDVMWALRVLVVAFSVAVPQLAHASLINADFESGLTGWTTFTTAGGVLNATTSTFDVDGDGTSSSAATFQVGRIDGLGPQEGGGIYQSFLSPGGVIKFSADIAVRADSSGDSAGGLFQMLWNGIVVASFDFGPITGSTTERSALLEWMVNSDRGTGDLRVLMTRGDTTGASSPFQYIDNVSVSSDATVPEPTSLTLLGLGLAGMGVRRWRPRKA